MQNLGMKCLRAGCTPHTGCKTTSATRIAEINERKKDFDHAEFRHEMRDSNWEAHDIARGSLGLGQGRHVWLAHPPDFVNIPVLIHQ